MIGEKELFRIEYYEYGEPYFGSDGGMNYRVAREPLENVHFIPPEKRPAGVLRASAWQGPWNFAVTPEKEIQTKEFAFTEEGLQEAIAWLNDVQGEYHEFRGADQ